MDRLKNAIFIVLLLAVTAGAAPKEKVLPQPTAEEVQKMVDAVPTKPVVKPSKSRKMLVFYLCKGFKHTSIPFWNKALEIMGQRSGAYEVVVSDDMMMFKAEKLKQFDAVCFNNTTKLTFDEDPSLKKSLMDFVKSGKGIVGVHAATDNFYDWPEMAEIMGGQFAGHPWRKDGTWAIKIDDADHPLMAAFKGKGFKINDEIYRTPPPLYSRSKQRVLMSLDLSDEVTSGVDGIIETDSDTGITWIKDVGKGRLFYCSLGHNNPLTWNPTVLQHYLAGIQFALGDYDVDTTPIVKGGERIEYLKQLLQEIATYEYGKGSEELYKIDEILRASEPSAEIEKLLLDFLNSDATVEAKRFVCRKLSLFATEASVATLAGLLGEDVLSNMARFVLERIPGDAADKALRDGLSKSNGNTRIGIINTLGRRGDEKAIALIEPLIYDDDSTTAEAAVSALGQIGGQSAADALDKAIRKTTGRLHQTSLDGYLNCADIFISQDNEAEANKIYSKLYSSNESTVIRAAALRGLVLSSGPNAQRVILKALKNPNLEIQSEAITLTRVVEGEQMTEAMVQSLFGLSAGAKMQMISELASRGDKSALTAINEAADDRDASVRLAAFAAVGKLGDSSSVEFLARKAAKALPDEAQAARNSLYNLASKSVDRAILKAIPQVEAQIKLELIEAVSQRKTKGAVNTLLKTASDKDSKVRLESLKVLADIAPAGMLPKLIDLMVEAQTESERKEAENTVAAVAGRVPGSNGVDQILAKLEEAKDIETRLSLLRVLGKLGADKALPPLREALRDKDPQIRYVAISALSGWPDAAPIEDLLKIAETSQNKLHMTLALRGYIKLIAVKRGSSDETKLSMYRAAIALGEGTAERRMVLSGLGQLKSFSAMQMAAGFLSNPALQEEAAAAIVKIAPGHTKKSPEKTKKMLDKVLAVAKSPTTQEDARKLLNKIK
jgi:hypothetical protein